ncbi:Hypothetical predicted protein [Mytilus galloprovincialis]|uniref:Arrestin C-terminal-like domain-containing protein n=1 Tax=Mytilus galloprovincialis TaxID=29158 RepID=A0A8B6CM54_MYTGA|nr:Hypothetical predicted protein [Mytilus galloprovincialis]
MGKLNAFIIQLQNQNAIFYPGQPVHGQVYVDLNADMKMREVRLKFEGYGNVHWSEQHSSGSGKNRHTRTVHYRARENYFDITVALYGQSLGHGEKLPSGQHNFPFQFILPPTLPSSFEHQYGQVRYMLKATIDKPWKFDHHTKLPFTVVSLLDLNAIPEAPRPMQNQVAKTLCCLCCESGPITGVLRVDKTGYVPGEAIYLQGEIQNLSDTECSVEVRLNLNMLFHATSKTRSVPQEVTKLVLDRSNPGETQSLSGKRIVIPPVAPSFLAGCSIIDIRYHLELHVNPSSVSKRLIVPVDIIIGSIPLRSSFHSIMQPQPAIAPHDVNINVVGQGPGAFPSAPELPPPSYAECVFGKTDMHDEDDNEHTKGQMSYAPAYPYYNFS